MSDIFREVDEEVRKDRFAELWKKYGGYVIVAILALVLGTAANVGWREYTERQKQAEAAQYFGASSMLTSGQTDQAIAAFATLADDASGGYAVLAKLREAAARATAGDLDGAVAIYDGLAGDDGVESAYRDLARLLAAQHLIDSVSISDIEARLQPLLADDSAWRHSARELVAIAAMGAGEIERARSEFERLAGDEKAPAGVRARVSELLTALDKGR